jgi:hypothetical protein
MEVRFEHHRLVVVKPLRQLFQRQDSSGRTSKSKSQAMTTKQVEQ